MWSWWREREAEDYLVLGCLGWLGGFWSLVAFAIATIWDRGQSWFDPDRVAFPFLLLRILIFWPVWSAVQVEHSVNTLGFHPGDLSLVLILLLLGALPMLLLGVVSIWWGKR